MAINLHQWAGGARRVGARRQTVAAALAALGLAGLAGPAAAIQGGLATTGFASVGTGVQVTADWVFTAQHAGLAPGDTFTNGYGSRTVAARFDAPGSGTFPANDFTLLRLVAAPTTAPLLAVESLVPADGAIGPFQVTITSASANGLTRSYGYTTVDSFVSMIDPDDAGPLGPVTANYLLSHSTSTYVLGGDSGRGLFLGEVVDTGSQTGILWGINSGQLQDAGGSASGSAFVVAAAYRAWIDQVMRDDLSDAQSVLWVTSVPEPATWALWGLGGFVLAGAARRRMPRAADQG